MAPKVFNHSCIACRKTYFSYEEDKVFCSDSCIAYIKYHGHTKPVMGNQELYKIRAQQLPPKKKKETYAEKWLNRKPPEENKGRLDSTTIMYHDTFKKYIPKSLKVMRG
jgi:hypothetical protein